MVIQFWNHTKILIQRNNSVRASFLASLNNFWLRASNLAVRINFDKKVSSNARTHQRINSDGYTRLPSHLKLCLTFQLRTKLDSGSSNSISICCLVKLSNKSQHDRAKSVSMSCFSCDTLVVCGTKSSFHHTVNTMFSSMNSTKTTLLDIDNVGDALREAVSLI